MKIQTNIPNLTNQRYVGNSRQTEEKESIRLSSGSRITQAADDPAGLAIAETMRSRIRSYRQAGRNASDGISLLQTADGSLSTISNNVVRLRELAMQAASDTVSNDERRLAGLEFIGLKKEIERVTSSTEFNGTKILNGANKVYDLQVGINNNPSQDRLSYNLKKVMKKIGDTSLSGATIESKTSAQNSLGKIDSFLSDLNTGRAEVGSVMKRMESIGQGIAISDESHSASRSKITDTDYALSAANRANANIRLEAGISVLSQTANVSKSALRLLD
ncbi:MAG: flagellin [Bacteriovoracaceae bacterium]